MRVTNFNLWHAFSQSAYPNAAIEIITLNYINMADCITTFDMAATSRFLDDLRAEKTVRKAKIEVALIGMRVDARTLAAAALRRFLDNAGFPLLAMLSDTQIYVHAANEGLSLFDMAPSRAYGKLDQWQPYKSRFENSRFIKSRAARELEQWQPVLDWLDQ